VSRYACRRCDWTPTGDQQRAQLADHATEANHPVCVICGQSLDRTERQTCMLCVGSVRRDLHRIVDLYALLPGELGHPTAAPMDPTGGHHGDEHPIPGGQILPLLAGGSRGLSQITGAPTSAGGRDFSHDADEHQSDPQSIAFELSRWEDDWRHHRREPAAEESPTVSGCSSYLFRRITWAADHSETFDEFADDIATNRYRLERVTATDDTPETGAPCQNCGSYLRREWTDEGLADDWKCPRCRETYTDAQYWLAVRAQLEGSA
jgi:hypothetical protein